jgi:hypothetical protein
MKEQNILKKTNLSSVMEDAFLLRIDNGSPRTRERFGTWNHSTSPEATRRTTAQQT